MTAPITHRPRTSGRPSDARRGAVRLLCELDKGRPDPGCRDGRSWNRKAGLQTRATET